MEPEEHAPPAALPTAAALLAKAQPLRPAPPTSPFAAKLQGALKSEP